MVMFMEFAIYSIIPPVYFVFQNRHKIIAKNAINVLRSNSVPQGNGS